MKAIAGFLFLVIITFALTYATLSVAAMAIAPPGDNETPNEFQIKCIEEGGCMALTRRELMEFRNAVLEDGRNRGREEGARACAKGRT